MGYTPLHKKLDGMAERGVLTGEAEEDDVDSKNQRVVEEALCG
jgi:hypothetical protein